MTIPEEIEYLKSQLAQASDETNEAELLTALLKKLLANYNPVSKDYIGRLLQLADKLASEYYMAWGLHYSSVIDRQAVNYTDAINFAQKALDLFEQLKNMEGIATVFLNIGIIYSNQDNYTEALENLIHAIKAGEEAADKPVVSAAYVNIGNINIRQSNYPEALKYYTLSLDIKEQIDDQQGMAVCYNNMGVVYKEQGNYPVALENYMRAFHIREKIGDKQVIGSSYHNIGSIYELQYNYPEAMKNYLKGLQINQEIGRKRGMVYSLNSIGNIHTLQGSYPEAMENYLQALQISLEIGENQGIADSYGNIGKVHAHQGNYPEALKNHYKALEISKKINDKRGIILCYKSIGTVYEKQGEHKEAVKSNLAALELAEEIGHKEVIKQSSRLLFNLYKATGDFEAALKFHERFHQVESEILGEQAQKQLTDLNFQHNMEQKEKEAEINRLRNVELKGALDHLQIEKDRSESLLLNILPSEVAEELKEKGESEAKLFEDVTVLFTDFKGFTTISEQLTPQELVNELHACFKAFDEIIGKYNIEKIKTVGDAYLAASGLPVPNVNHAGELVSAAIEICNFMLNRRKVLGNKTFEMRVGLNSGKVVAGIVGVKKFAYDIWGDTVNTAARMEQNGETGKVNISEATYELVKNKFNCQYRGEIEAKNKGKLKMYFAT